jgi:hypothetical protein
MKLGKIMSVKFRVGDKVRIRNNLDVPWGAGYYGVIVRKSPEHDGSYWVRFGAGGFGIGVMSVHGNYLEEVDCE